MKIAEYQILCPENYHDLIIYELSGSVEVNFLEEEHMLYAYTKFNQKNINNINKILADFESVIPDFRYSLKELKEENWNKQWESQYSPVLLGNKYLIVAPFHLPIESEYPTIIINPEMSFGTGHHATTALMTDLMMKINLKSKKVLDFGCGSGILAIIASKEGSRPVFAIDNDSVAVKSTKNNVQINLVENVFVLKGNINRLKTEKFDIILANITKNTILRYSETIKECLNLSGTLICSGFYENDLNIIEEKLKIHGMKLKEKAVRDSWCAAIFNV